MNEGKNHLETALARANEKVKLLERMIEDSSRQLYQEREELRDINEWLQQIMTSMPSSLLVVEDGLIKVANQAACNLLGYLPYELKDRPADTVFDFRSLLSEASNSEAKVNCETFFFAKDGHKVPVAVTSSLMQGEHLKGSKLICLATDLSERKVLETQLLHAEKLESIGRLAAGIAHEINTPIQFVAHNTKFFADTFGDLQKVFKCMEGICKQQTTDEKITQALNVFRAECEKADLEYLREEIPLALRQSLEGVERVTKIVRAMKEFSHPGSDSKQSVDLNKLLESTVAISTNEWKYYADIKMDLDPRLPLVPCLPAEFNQVSLNVIVNAAHAIEEQNKRIKRAKGLITISTRVQGDFAEICFEDNGVGIPKEIHQKIFDPFFTTKGVGQGTGQGLTIARSVIVDKHQGSIEFQSELGRGTIFVIKLPLRSAKLQAVNNALASSAAL